MSETIPLTTAGHETIKPATGTARSERRDTTLAEVYNDKHGIPVTYDADTVKQHEQASSDAISVLSHELLSPLTLIKGYTSTLLQLKYSITEEQEEQYLHGIESACNRLICLLENLRDITLLEETNFVNAQSVSISELLLQIASEAQAQTTKHVIKFRPPARLPRIRIDPEKIAQVVNNLLTNAIKYSPQGGDIEVLVRMVDNEPELNRLFGDTPEIKLPSLVVTIADNGIGIPEHQLDFIFKKFYRVKDPQARGVPGAGLGLYICKTIVEAHGGVIWARNGIEGGTAVHFSLPLDRLGQK
jgi:signal transduction histidine kinase